MTPKKKRDDTKNVFDFITAITQDQSIEYFDSLTEEEVKLYKKSRYMINKILSMNPEYAEVIGLIQKYNGMPDRAHYMFLSGVLPKKKQFNKYIKSTAETKYPTWLISLIKNHFTVSSVEAVEYLDILYTQNKDEVLHICKMYAVDPKLLKELKL
jgi:hypothetical protein